LTQDVQAPSTTTLTSNPNPSIFGSPVSFTVTVPAIGSVAATGTVNILEAGQATPINSVSLTAGTATFTISSLPVGTDVITASYQGDLYYGPSTSPAVSQIVNQATTATTVIAAPNPAIVGAPVTITATVHVTLGVSTPSGNVTFTDSLNGGAAVTLGSVALGGAGTASISPALLAGSHSIVATYAGDTNDTGSASAPYSLTVTQESITLSSSPNPSIYGNAVSFTVTVPAIGSVAATGTVNILQAGQVAPIKTVSLTAGTVTFTISSLPVGTDVITASYLGDSIYIPIVSSAVSQVVNPAQTSTSLAAVPSLGIAGAPVAITATVHVTLGASTPTGNVTFTDTFNGATVPLGASTPLSGGAATINPTLALGAHSIVATYAGDTNDAGSASSSLALIVVQATTTTTLTSSGSPSLVLAPVTFTAHVASIGGGTPAGNVTFLDSLNGGATVIMACSPQPVAPTAACTTSALVAGTHSITAIYGGDTNDVSSTTTISQVVGTIPTLTGLGVSTTGGANPQVILVATVVNDPTAIGSPTPTGTVIFSTVVGSALTQIGSSTLDSSGVATMVPSLANGSYNLEVSYGGDANHSPSTSNVVHISTTPAGFSLTVTPASVTIPATQSATVTVALTSTNSFADTIGLGCASLPAGVNCHFSAPNATLPANGSQNVSLTIDTNNPLGGGASAMNIHPGSRVVSLAGFFLPLSSLFGLFLWRFRRRYARLLTMALLLGAAALVATGCSGSFSQTAAAPGTYVIQVIGVGANSNISQYQNVTLIVTK
jgi:hypothetical protein